MKTHFNPKNNPRVIIIQKLYGKFYNEDNELSFKNIDLKNLLKILFLELLNVMI